MATNAYDPTAANILASLGILGATPYGGAGAAGKVPVILENGLLDTSLFPISAIAAQIDLPSLSNTAFVDKNAGSGMVGYVPTGSIALPFRTLDEAAVHAEFSNFILVPNNYTVVSRPVFATTSSVIRILSLGPSTFSSLTLSRSQIGTQFVLSDVSVENTLFVESNVTCRLRLTGNGAVNIVKGSVNDDSDPISSPWYLDAVEVGSEVVVSNYVYVDPTHVAYLSTSSRVTNSSSIVSGKTVKDATDTLGLRRIRMPVFSADASGIHAYSAMDIAVSGDSSDSYEYHDIRALGTTLANAANATFYKEGDSPEFGQVEADVVQADTVAAGATETETLKIGGCPLNVSTDGFLVLEELSESSS